MEEMTQIIVDSRNFAIVPKNGKVVSVRNMKTNSVNGGVAPLIFNLSYTEVRCQLHIPAVLPLKKKVTNTLRTRGWVGTRFGLDALEKRNIPWYCRESNKDTSVAKPVPYEPLV